jgi:hypothetical protein
MLQRLNVLAAGVLLSACATVGQEVDMAAVDRLQPGVATVQEAIAVLGPYSTQAANSAGIKTYGWTYAHTNGLTGKMESQAVMLSFGPDGKLVQKSSSSLPRAY